MSGTAISAPLVPVVSLLIVLAFVHRRDGWFWLGIAAGYFTSISVAIGGFGELVAEPTEDTPKAVLVGSGIVFLALGLALAVLSTAAAAQRVRTGTASVRTRRETERLQPTSGVRRGTNRDPVQRLDGATPVDVDAAAGGVAAAHCG